MHEPAWSLRERAWMKRALALALRGWGQTAPNPMVGAVVVRDGKVVGTGFHAVYGGRHAEPHALAAAGDLARGAELYCTLEPCNAHGKQPPCVDAIIAAGIRRVVCAVRDPNPAMQGGADRLRAAGIEVAFGLLEPAAREQLAPFLFWAGGATRPFITLKLALSLDGAIAAADRQPRWLTGELSRKQVHRLRANADAVAVGSGTALADNPALTVRGVKKPRVAPLRVVFDRRARLPIGATLVRTAKRVPTLVLTEDATAAAPLAARGVEVVPAPSLTAGLQALHGRGVRHLLVEGGAGLAGALLGANLVDRLVIFQAPVLLGPGALGAWSAAPGLDVELPRWNIVERKEFGDDLMTVFSPPKGL